MTELRTESGVAAGGRRLPIALGLLALGVLVWVVAVLVGRGEPRSYSTHSAPPAFVGFTAGQEYSLATADGMGATPEENAAVTAAVRRCTVTDDAGAVTALSVAAETNPKALHRVGTFVAPFSGRGHVSCTGLGEVYIDDPDGSVDSAGLLRVLAVVLLAVGVPLSLSALRRA